MKLRLLTAIAVIFAIFNAVADDAAVQKALADFEQAAPAARPAAATRLLAELHAADDAYPLISFKADTPAPEIEKEIWLDVADYCYNTNRYDRCADYALRALPLWKGGDFESDCLNLLAMAYFRLSDYTKAARYALQCYDIDARTGDPDIMSSTLNTIAGIYLGANQPQKAEEYILKAIDLNKQTPNRARQAVIEGMASEIYHAMVNDDEALRHIDIACDIERSLGRDDKLAVRLVQRASILNGLHRYAEAEQLLRPLIPQLQAAGDLHSLAIAYNKLGMALFSQQRHAEAVTCFRQAATLFMRMGDLGNELHARRGLYESLWYSNPDSAKLELDRFDLLKDSLYSTATAANLARFDAEMNNDWLRQENTRQQAHKRAIIIISIIAALVIAAVVWWLMRRRSHLREAALQAIIDRLQADTDTEAATPAPAEPTTDDADSRFLRSLIDIVKRQPEGANISIEEIAATMCVTRGQLNRRVKAIAGVTTQQYVTRIRLEQARDLLAHSSLTVAEVGARFGFDDPSSFSRAFRRAFGQSPSSLR